MKLYLDDLRPTPDGWIGVRRPDEAIALLATGKVVEISLDHDLGDDRRGTGYDVVVWMEREASRGRLRPPLIHIHTANPSARHRMMLGVENIYRLAANASALAATTAQSAKESNGRSGD